MTNFLVKWLTFPQLDLCLMKFPLLPPPFPPKRLLSAILSCFKIVIQKSLGAPIFVCKKVNKKFFVNFFFVKVEDIVLHLYTKFFSRFCNIFCTQYVIHCDVLQSLFFIIKVDERSQSMPPFYQWANIFLCMIYQAGLPSHWLCMIHF